MSKGLPDYLTTKEVAASLGTTTKTIYTLIEEGKFLRPIRLGKKYRWDAGELRKWLKSRKI